MFWEKFRVELTDRGYHDRSALEATLIGYAQVLKKNIIVSIPHREAAEIEVETDTLYIKCYSTPVITGSEFLTIPSAFGLELGSDQEDALRPSGLLQIVYDENEIAVAEFTEGTIFVLFDLPDGPNCGFLIGRIMDEYLQFISHPDDFKKRMSKIEDEMSFKNFSEICDEEGVNQVELITEDIKGTEAAIRELQKEIVQQNRELGRLQKKQRMIRLMLAQGGLNETADKFKSLQKYVVGGKVRVEKDRIIIPVGQIDIEFEDDVYDIGEFDIIIVPNGNYGGVLCVNKTRSVGGNYHPHIDDDGTCCLGNISEMIATMVGRMRYEETVSMMIQFLRTCNEDGWYEEVTSWPIKGAVDDDEND